MMQEQKLDCAVIGGGPAGLSAAINLRQRGKTVRVLGAAPGLLAKAEQIDNYLGLPGLTGAAMLEAFAAHARSLGIEAEEGRVADVFTSPQSEIAKELILPQDRKALAAQTDGGRRLRIIFDGQKSRRPVISDLVLECQAPVNILFADTKDFEGTVYGHMILELPHDKRQEEKIVAWLKNSGVTWKEEV